MRMSNINDTVCDPELIGRFYDRELDNDESLEVGTHIESCAKCSKVLSEYSTISGKIESVLEKPFDGDSLKTENLIIEAIRKEKNPWWLKLADLVFTKKILVPAIMTASVALLVTTYIPDNSDKGPGAIITSLSSSGSVVILETEGTHQQIIWFNENG